MAFKLEGRHDSKRTTASRVEDEKKWAKWIESDSGGIEHGCKLHSVAPASSNESYGVNSACEALCVCDWKPHDATTTLDSDTGEDCNNRAWADYDVACKLEGRHDPYKDNRVPGGRQKKVG